MFIYYFFRESDPVFILNFSVADFSFRVIIVSAVQAREVVGMIVRSDVRRNIRMNRFFVNLISPVSRRSPGAAW
jgi:hypothetical protein